MEATLFQKGRRRLFRVPRAMGRDAQDVAAVLREERDGLVG